ncbi:hypothetical protein QWA68_010254 [Fusarium oxysporum]|nr:hypothetical protein QWA68_010254 [Fusarium oxysporum]
MLLSRDLVTLCSAVRKGDLAMVKSLVGAGYDVKRTNVLSQTPLHSAILSGNYEIAEFLLSCKTAINGGDNEGMTPLRSAIQQRRVDLVELLLKHSAETKEIKLYEWFEGYNLTGSSYVCLTENGGEKALSVARVNEIASSNEAIQGPRNRSSEKRFFLFKNSLPWQKGLIRDSIEILQPNKLHLSESVCAGDGRHLVLSAAILLFPWHPDQAFGGLLIPDKEECRITWTIRRGVDTRSEPVWVPLDFFSTLQNSGIPEDGAEFFTQFLDDLERRWLGRLEQLKHKGSNLALIDCLAVDARQWAEFRKILKGHAQDARSFAQKYCQRYNGGRGLKRIRESIDRIEKRVNEQFAWISITEVRKSTSVATSMKRLSWITFIFLPAMFASSLFGMNVNLLSNNPDWRWYILVAGVVLTLTVVGWLIFKELAELIKYQIQPLMERCREQHVNHERCGMEYVSSGLPTRLLDVGETNGVLVKLVEAKSCTNLRHVDYLILSYCWGNGNEKSKTTETNLGMRLRGFAVSDLSKTIQDAILLTRLMGFQYLWVDAICIIQGPAGDFRSESPRMGDYYSNSACCISASVAKDSQEGFLTERPLARFPMDDIALRIANHPTAGPGYTTFKASDDDRSLVSNIHGSPLAKRGWCLQETALPKRILHWTLQGLYLQCQSSIFSEDSKVPHIYQAGCGHFSPREVMTRPDKDIVFSGGWYQLISVFSKTQLTYETDRLYAIHGLASILIQRLRAEYFNGLFRPTLAQGLLWYHDSNRREADKRPKDAQLPSWCWASACPISYLDIQETPIYVKDDHPERPLQFPTHSEALSVIESTTSRLYIRAPIFQLTIGRSDVGYVKNVHSGHTESFPCRYFLDANRQVLQSMPQSSSVGGEWGQGVDVLWFPVGRDHHAYPYVPGLLVYEVPDEGKGVYRRYGLLQCSDSWLDEKDFEDAREIILV